MGLVGIVRREEGAAAVEFAIVLTVFLMLVFGMLTGGITYNHRLNLTHSAREAARHGATKYLDPQAGGVSAAWLLDLRDRAVDSAFGNLDPLEPGRSVCVAYVGASPADPSLIWTQRWLEDSSVGSTSPQWCFPDQRGDEPRIQVAVGRDSDFNTIVFDVTIPLSSEAVARYELVRR